MDPRNLVGPGRLLPLAGCLLTALLAGCESRAKTEDRPPPKVVVVNAERMNVPIVVSTNGVARSLNEVTIRARVKGFLKEKHFQEGSNVKAGQLLFVIDEEPFQVKLQEAQANLAKAQAELTKAEESKAKEVARAQLGLDEAALKLTSLDERRQAELLARKASPQATYDVAEANLKKATAQVDADRAHLDQAESDYKTAILAAKAQLETAKSAVRNAEIELSYCRMDAPISGRIGEMRVKIGNLVGGDESTPLAVIQQLDPIGIDLRPSAGNIQRVTAVVKRGLNFTLDIHGEWRHPHEARAVFVDNQIDPNTSTVLIKAEVPNPDESILPGAYVRARAVIGEYPHVIVIPERAVMEGQSGSTVYVVDDQNQIAVAHVKPVDTYRGLRVIDSGLEPGQRVVVEGFQLVRPGMAVQAEEQKLVIPPEEEQTPVIPAAPTARPAEEVERQDG